MYDSEFLCIKYFQYFFEEKEFNSLSQWGKVKCDIQWLQSPPFFIGKEQSMQGPLRLFHFSKSCVAKRVLPQTAKHSQYIPNSYSQVKVKTVLVQ